MLFQSVTNCTLCQIHTQTKFCVIFKQRVCPRWTATLFVHSIWCRWSRNCPNRRTACCIGNHHSIAVQLCYQFSIRSLTTACTSTGELEQWLFKLTSFYSRCFKFLKYLRFFINGLTIVIYFLERHLSVNWFHNQCFLAFFTWAYLCTTATTCAVQCRNSHNKF